MEFAGYVARISPVGGVVVAGRAKGAVCIAVRGEAWLSSIHRFSHVILPFSLEGELLGRHFPTHPPRGITEGEFRLW